MSAPERNIHIIYRHIPVGAEKNSRDPHKSRPPWFSYQTCFRNLLNTVRADPFASRVKLTVLFDGTVEDFMQDFVATYYANPALGVGLQLIRGGSNANSFLIALDMVRRSEIADTDLVYFLENDYLHAHGWVRKVLELYATRPVDIVSLYDHRDKYDFAMYDDLVSRLVYSPTHHWRTVPSTCGSFIVDKAEMLRDYDLWTSNMVDYHLFPALLQRGRILLTPVPGLATHAMAGYLSPVVDWDRLAAESKLESAS
jgi:hypothetical protein